MDVVEEQDDRLLGGKRFEQTADSPEGLLARAAAVEPPKQLTDPLDYHRAVPLVLYQRADLAPDRVVVVILIEMRRLANCLGHWPVRDPFAVRQAPSVENEC